LDAPPPAEGPVSILEYYARVPWIGAGPDDDVHVNIRAGSTANAVDGPVALAARAEAAVDDLRQALLAAPPERLMRLPIFGSLISMFALSRFTHNLAMLYRSGIPLLKGLEICRGLVGNRAIEHAIDEVHRGVSEGTPLSKCLTEHDVFPPTLVTMIASGETSGSLDFSLQSVSDYYNKMIPRRIKIVFSIFDPVMMVGLIAVVGCVALAVVLPILQLWDAK